MSTDHFCEHSWKASEKEVLFLHFPTENTSLCFSDFFLKEREKGGTATAKNACFTLQIILKQQLADVLTKVVLSQERILSRKDWDLKIQISNNYKSSQRAENISLCGAEVQGLRAEVTWPRHILILMSVNSPGPKDPPSLDMSGQMWAGTWWDTSCFIVHQQLWCQAVKIPSHRAKCVLLQCTLNNSWWCKGCSCFWRPVFGKQGKDNLVEQLPS